MRRIPQVFSAYVFIIACATVITAVSLLPLRLGAEVGTANCAAGYVEVNGACKPAQENENVGQTNGTDSKTTTSKTNTTDTTHCDLTTFQAAVGGSQSCYEPGVIGGKSGQCSPPPGAATCASLKESAINAMGGGGVGGSVPTKPEDIIFGPETPVQSSGQVIPNSGQQTPLEVVNTKVVNAPSALDRLESMLGLGENGSGDKPTTLLPGPASANLSDYTKFTPYDNGAPQFDMASVRAARAGDAFYDGVMSNLFNNLDSLPMQFTPPNVGDVLSGRIFGPPSTFAPVGTAGFAPTPGTGMAPGQNLVSRSVPTSNVPNPLQSAYDRLTNPFSSSPLAGTAGLPGALLAQMSPSGLASLTPSQQATLQEQLARYQEQQPQNTVFMTTDAAGRPVLAPTPDSLTQPLTSDPFAGESAALARLANGDNLLDPNTPVIPGPTPSDSLKGIVEVSAATPLTPDGASLVSTEDVRDAFQRGNFGEAIAKAGEGMIESTQRLLASIGQGSIKLIGLGAAENTIQSVSDALGFSGTGGVDTLAGSGQDDIPTGDIVYTDANNNDQGTPGAPSGIPAQATPALSQSEKNALAEYQQAQTAANDVANSTDEQVKADAAVAKAQSALEKSGIDPETGQKVVETKPFSPENNPELGGSKERADALKDTNKTTTVTYCDPPNSDCTRFRNVEYRTEAEAKVAEQANKTAESLDRDVKSIQAEQKALADARTWDQKARDLLPDSLRPAPSKDYLICNDADCTNPKQATYNEYKTATDQQIESLKAAEAVEKSKAAYIENGLPSSDKVAEKLSGATLDNQPQRTYYDMFGNEYRNAEAAKGADTIALNNESRAAAISGTEKSVSDMEAQKAKYDADVQAQIDAGKIKQADPFVVTVNQNGKEVKMSFEEYRAQAAASVDAMKQEIADSSKVAQDLKQTFAPRPGDGPSVPPISEEAKMHDLAERKLEETAVLKAVEAKTNQDKEFAAIAKLTDAQRRDQAPQIEARLAQAAKDVNAYTTKAQELAGVVPQTQETKDAVAAVERVLTQGTTQLERNIAGLKDWGKDMTGPVGFMVRSIGGSLGNATELVTSYLPNQPAQVVIGKMFDTNPEFTKFITPVKIAGELVNVVSTPLLLSSPSRAMVESALASQLEARTAALTSSPLISAPSTAAATADSALARAAAVRAEIMDAGIQARFGAPVGTTPVVVESRLAPIASVDAAGNGVVRLEPVVTASSRAEGAVVAEGLPGARAGVGEVVGGGIAREITAADIAAKAPVADSAFGRVAQTIKEAGGPDLLGPAWNKAVAPVETVVSGVEAAGASAARRIDNAVADAYKFMNGSYPPGSFRAFEAQFPAAERAGVSAAVDANAALGRTLSGEAKSAISGYESAAAQAAAERARMEAATAAGRTATARAEVQDALAAARARLEQAGLEPVAADSLAVRTRPQVVPTVVESGATVAELQKGVALDAAATAKAVPVENVSKANAALADTVAAADKGAAARAIKNYESAQADFAKLARENPSSSALDASAARMRSAAQDLAKYDLEPATAGSKVLQKSIVPQKDIVTLTQIEKDVSQAVSKGDYAKAYDALQKERPALAMGDNSQAYLLSPSGRARIELENRLFNYTNEVAQGIRMENALAKAELVNVEAAAKAQPTSFSTNISNAIAACSKGGSCDPRILLTKSLPSPARLLNGAVTASIAFQALAPTVQVARMVETGAARVAVVSTKAASTPYLYGKLAPVVSTDAARVASIKSAVTPAQLAQSYRILASVPEVKAAVASPSVPAAQAAASQATAVGDYATKVGSALKSAGLEATPLAQTMAQVARDPALALAETAPVRAALADATAQARAAAIAASAAGTASVAPVPATPDFRGLNATAPVIAEVLAQQAFLSDRGPTLFEKQQPTILGSAAEFINQVVGITPAVAQGRDICAGNNCGGHKYVGQAMEKIRSVLGYAPGEMGVRIGNGGERYATYANLGEWLAADIIKRQAYVTQLGKDVLLGNDTNRSQDAAWAVPDRDHAQPVAVLRQQRLNAFAKSGLTTEEATTPFTANDIDRIEKISIATACAEYSKCSPDFIPQAERDRARQILARAGIISPQQTVSAPLSVAEKQVAQNAITNAQAAGMRIPTAVAQALTPWAFQERRAVLEGQRIISEVAQNPALTNPAAHAQYTALAQSGGAIQIPGAAGQTIYLPGSEFSSAVPSRQYLVMHHQAGMNALNRATQYHTGAVNVGTRYWIKQNGDIVVARRDGTIEAHIGQIGPSDLDGRKIVSANNANATGIEFEGYGYNTAEQMQSGVALALFLQTRHSISPDRVIPHLKDTDRQEGVAMTQVMRTIAFVPHKAEEQFAKIAQVLQKGIQGIVQAAGQNAATLAAKIQGIQKTLRTVSTPFSDSAVSKTALAQPMFATRSGPQLGAVPAAEAGAVRAAPAAAGAAAVVPSALAVTEALAKASAASDAYKQAATGFVRAVESGDQSLLNSINALSKASDTAYTEAFEAARTYLVEAGATDAVVAAKAKALNERAVSAKAKLASDTASLKQKNAQLAEYVGASDAHAAAMRDIISEAKDLVAKSPSSGISQVRVTTVPVLPVTEKISPPSSLKFRTGSNINPEQARAYLATDASMILGGDPSSEGWDALAKAVKDSGGRLHMYDFGPGGPTNGVMTVAESSEQAAKARELGLARDQWLAGTWNEGKPTGWLKSSTDRIAKYQPYSVEFDNLDRLPWLRNDGAATVSFFKEYQKWADANGVATRVILKNLDQVQWQALAGSIRSGELRGSTFANIAINEGTLVAAPVAKAIGITEVRTTDSGNYPTPNDLRSDPAANAIYAAYPTAESSVGVRTAGVGKVDGFDLAQATKAGVKLSLDPHVLSTASEEVPFKIVYTDPASKLTADLTMADYARLTPSGRKEVQMVVTDGNGKAQALSPAAFDEYMSAKFSVGQSGNAVAQLKSDIEKLTGVKATDMKPLTGKNATTVHSSEAGKYSAVATYRSGDSIVRVGTMMPDTAAIVKAFDECKNAGVCAANAKLTFDIKSKNSWRSTSADSKPVVFEIEAREVQSAVAAKPAAQSPGNGSGAQSARFVQGNHTINPYIGASMKVAAEHWGPEYEFRVISGQAGRSSGTKNHPANRAVDITIYKNGVALKNIRSPETFAVYRDFMQDVKHFQDQLFPELRGQGRWGGYFVSGVGQDLMHYDLDPSNVMAAGSWEGGLRPQYAFYGIPGDVGKGMGNLATYKPAGTSVGGPSVAAAPAKPTITIQKSVSIKLATPAIADRGIADAGRLLGKEIFNYKVTGSESTHEVRVYASKNNGVLAGSQSRGKGATPTKATVSIADINSLSGLTDYLSRAYARGVVAPSVPALPRDGTIRVAANAEFPSVASVVKEGQEIGGGAPVPRVPIPTFLSRAVPGAKVAAPRGGTLANVIMTALGLGLFPVINPGRVFGPDDAGSSAVPSVDTLDDEAELERLLNEDKPTMTKQFTPTPVQAPTPVKLHLDPEKGWMVMTEQTVTQTPPPGTSPGGGGNGGGGGGAQQSPIQKAMSALQDMMKKMTDAAKKAAGGGAASGAAPAAPTNPPTSANTSPTIRCTPSSVASATTKITVSWTCSGSTSSVGTGFSTTGKVSGVTTATIAATSSPKVDLTISCLTNAVVTGTASCPIDVIHPSVAGAANPSTVESGKGSQVVWTSVQTTGCSVYAPPSVMLVTGGSSGRVDTPALVHTSIYKVVCGTKAGTAVTAPVTIVVAGDDSAPLEAVVPATAQTKSMTTSGTSASASGVSGTAGTVGATIVNGQPVQLCNPGAGMTAFVHCISGGRF